MGGTTRSAPSLLGLIRSKVTVAITLAAVTAVVLVMAVTAPGFPVSHVSADDGGVWLVNDQPEDGFGGAFS